MSQQSTASPQSEVQTAQSTSERGSLNLTTGKITMPKSSTPESVKSAVSEVVTAGNGNGAPAKADKPASKSSKSSSKPSDADIAKARADVKSGRKRPSEAAMELLAKSKPAKSGSSSKSKSKPQPSEHERIKATLKRAQLSENAELTDERRERVLNAPANLSGASLRNFIQHGSTSGKPTGETRERFADHKPIADAATKLLRVDAPKRGACSTRAVEFTLKHVGRKDVSKLLGGITDKQLKQIAEGKLSVRKLDEQPKTAVDKTVKAIAAASKIVRFDARTLAAILVVSKGS